ncbi:MAG: hypothetical protein FWD15_04840 [Alphaproteobacteria bacterium]|nr:hypothetical protein [Alphaproteobacteria bacterium]
MIFKESSPILAHLENKNHAMELIGRLREKKEATYGSWYVANNDMNLALDIALSGHLDKEAYEALDEAVFERNLSKFYAKERMAMAMAAFNKAQASGLYFPADPVYEKMEFFCDKELSTAADFKTMVNFFKRTVANKKVVIENYDRAAYLAAELMNRVLHPLRLKPATAKQKAEVARAAHLAAKALVIKNGDESMMKVSTPAMKHFYNTLIEFKKAFGDDGRTANLEKEKRKKTR